MVFIVTLLVFSSSTGIHSMDIGRFLVSETSSASLMNVGVRVGFCAKYNMFFLCLVMALSSFQDPRILCLLHVANKILRFDFLNETVKSFISFVSRFASGLLSSRLNCSFNLSSLNINGIDIVVSVLRHISMSFLLSAVFRYRAWLLGGAATLNIYYTASIFSDTIVTTIRVCLAI